MDKTVIFHHTILTISISTSIKLHLLQSRSWLQSNVNKYVMHHVHFCKLAHHRTDGPQKQIVAQIPENSFLLWWQSQQYQQAAWSLKYNFWQTLCHHSWWEIWFRAAFLQNSSKSARWPSWKQFSDNLLRQKWPEELRSYAPTKSLNLMTFNIWHSTNGPMDQRTNGPMDQWTNGPMDQ